MKLFRRNQRGNSNTAGCMAIAGFGIVLCFVLGMDPSGTIIGIGVLLGLGWLLLIFLKSKSSSNPDKIITHTKDFFGRNVTEIEDTKTGSKQTRVSDKDILGQRRTNVYLTKQCYKCRRDVQRSSDGCYYCCGRSFR